MGDPFDGEWVWSRTDHAVIAVTSPSCVGYLWTELGKLITLTSWRLVEHAEGYPLPPNRSPRLRAIVHARAARRYGAQVDPSAPDVEVEALCAMSWQQQLLVEILPHTGGVIEMPSYHHEGALLALLCDLREAMPVDIDRALLRYADDPRLDVYVTACQAIAHRFGAALHAWHANNQAEALPAGLARRLAG